jgi:hypothetical protein
MRWNEIRKGYPNQWLVVEAVSAHTTSTGKREITDIKVLDLCPDGASAFKKYRELHSKNHYGEYYYLHTSREVLDIEEVNWTGIRM